jgi:hypothetical protein
MSVFLSLWETDRATEEEEERERAIGFKIPFVVLLSPLLSSLSGKFQAFARCSLLCCGRAEKHPRRGKRGL